MKEHTRSHSESACCIVGRPAMTHNTTLATVTRAQRGSDENKRGRNGSRFSCVSLTVQGLFCFFFNLTRLHFNLRVGISQQRRAAGALYGGDERDGEESRVTSGVKNSSQHARITRPRVKAAALGFVPISQSGDAAAKPSRKPSR